MKSVYRLLIVLLVFTGITFSAKAEEETNAVYGETYLCGDAYTLRIVNQPQMMSELVEKANIDIGYKSTVRTFDNIYYYLYTEYKQAAIRYGQQTEEEVILHLRVELRNLNAGSLQGLSPDSFILTGKVRDRVIEYKPVVMTPFVMDNEWELPMIRAKVEAMSPMNLVRRPISGTAIFDISKYWNPLLMSERNIDSMRVQEMRLIYRVPSWLVGWELHVNPQPMTADPELKTCNLVLHLPTIMNEITHETYKYVW